MGELSFLVKLVDFGSCCVCGVLIVGPNERYRQAKDHKTDFSCINGHSQHFAESEVEKLNKQLAAEKQRREWAEKNAESARHDAATTRGKLKAQSQRIKNGVCPCCHRSFENLQRHMSTKHPEFAVPEVTKQP